MGKTTFFQLWSVDKALNQQGSITVVLNSDSTLLYRDYQKVNSMVDRLKQKHNKLNVDVKLIENPDTF